MKSLTSILASHFGGPTRSKGDSYFYRGRVDIVEGDESSVTAIVTGHDFYDVELSIEAETLSVFCTCPRFRTHYCKHIWATMLAAESDGFLTGEGVLVWNLA